MQTVGIDLHRSRSQVAVLDDDGKQVVSRRITNSPQAFLELLGEVDGDCRVAVEATYGWEWLADLLQGAGYELHLAHPTRTKAIAAARVKTDAVDALKRPGFRGGSCYWVPVSVWRRVVLAV